MRPLRLVAFVLFLVGAAGVAPPARAADDAPPANAPHTKTGEPKQGDHESGDDSLFGKALDLAIWTVVVFLLLLFVLSKYAWKPMLEGLQRREENIHAAVEEAQRARDEAQQLRQKLQAEMDQAAEKVRDMMDAARRDGERITNEMIAKTRTEIQMERERLHREIELARDQALQQLWTQTAQLATLVSAKAIRRQLTPEDHRRFVDEAIADLRQPDNQLAGI